MNVLTKFVIVCAGGLTQGHNMLNCHNQLWFAESQKVKSFTLIPTIFLIPKFEIFNMHCSKIVYFT